VGCAGRSLCATRAAFGKKQEVPQYITVEKHFHERSAELQIPPLRYPGFPVELGGADGLHAPFPYRKAHTRSFLALRGRKSGYASVGMTILFEIGMLEPQQNCRPEADSYALAPASRTPLLKQRGPTRVMIQKR
jgi:hypothetical protein